MSLKQSDSVLSLFSFWILRMSRAILTYLFFFFGEFGQEGQKRDTFYQSKADTAPPCSHGPLTEE